ncbi:prephenate dehydratase, partial [Francisella tularensis subsp. holarctica]|nr:prephenate dehydratase [Francisella tularensis subsp. holarctica]
DIEGSDDDFNVQQALLEVLKKSTFLKFLGSYKSYHFS